MPISFEWHVLVISALVVAAAFIVFGISAFGSALITVPVLSHFYPLDFVLPHLPAGWSWHLLADTSRPSPEDIYERGQEPRLPANPRLNLIPKSCVLCLGREDIAEGRS
jgi:hypothetical protein